MKNKHIKKLRTKMLNADDELENLFYVALKTANGKKGKLFASKYKAEISRIVKEINSRKILAKAKKVSKFRKRSADNLV